MITIKTEPDPKGAFKISAVATAGGEAIPAVRSVVADEAISSAGFIIPPRALTKIVQSLNSNIKLSIAEAGKVDFTCTIAAAQ